MATPKLQIHPTDPTEAAVTLAGKTLGTIKIELREIETIEGVDNPIVVVGECLNLQNGAVSGFVFQELTNLITAQDTAIEHAQEPTEEITTTEGN